MIRQTGPDEIWLESFDNSTHGDEIRGVTFPAYGYGVKALKVDAISPTDACVNGQGLRPFLYTRSGIPIESLSKVILRHANPSITQRYLRTVSEVEAMRWVDNLHG